MDEEKEGPKIGRPRIFKEAPRAFHMQMDAQMADHLEKAAKARGISQAEFVREVLARALARAGKTKAGTREAPKRKAAKR